MKKATPFTEVTNYLIPFLHTYSEMFICHMLEP